MIFRTTAILVALFVMSVAQARVDVADPWVRATVPGQKVTGAFMKITASADARLVEVRSPRAGTVEIHEVAMEGDRMAMRALSALPLPAGTAIELKPGSYHLMLLDLDAQVKEGDVVTIFLVIDAGNDLRETVEVEALARSLHASGHSSERSDTHQ